eukprot:5170694-Alexandrium_andersonii.AAC.1
MDRAAAGQPADAALPGAENYIEADGVHYLPVFKGMLQSEHGLARTAWESQCIARAATSFIMRQREPKSGGKLEDKSSELILQKPGASSKASGNKLFMDFN